MLCDLEIANPIHEADWDARLLATTGYSFFHSSAWARVLIDSYGYKPVYITSFDNDGQFLLSLPFMEVKSVVTGKRGVSLPFSDYCDPIISPAMKMAELFQKLVALGKKSGWKYLEIRGRNDFLEEQRPSKKFYHHILQLSEKEEDILGKVRDSTRRNIEKAIKQGVKIRIGDSIEDMREYYHLHCKTRKLHGLPPQPIKFFNNIFKFILTKKLGIVVLARHHDKCIAGNIYFHLGKKAYYKYGASDRRYQQYRAANLVMWEGIKHYAQNSYESLCFGRTDLDDKGLMQYKNGWGAECRMIKYYKYDLLTEGFIDENFAVNQNMKKIFKRLPIPLLKMTGSLLYRHIG